MSFRIMDYGSPLLVTPGPEPGPAPRPPSASTPKHKAPKPKSTSTKPSAAANAPKQPPGTLAGQLAAGKTLKPGEDIRSANGQYDLKMQADGNLVLYDIADSAHPRALWSTKTNGSGAEFARMDANGNLAVYKGKQAVWTSKTNGNAGASLTVQNDGNAVIYKPVAPGDEKPASVWSSKTAALPIDGQDNGSAPQVPSKLSASVGLFKPGMPELGAKHYTLGPGQSVWTLLQGQHVFDQSDSTNANPLLEKNRAPTPYLDTEAFGDRPANSVNNVYSIGEGKTVTVLDSSRLQFLEQERGQLKGIEAQTDPPQKTTQTQQLAGTIYNELDYAGTQQATPDPDALGGTIRMRAPKDQTFNTAVDAAVAKYKADLAVQGRTADQIGKIDAAAKSGNCRPRASIRSRPIRGIPVWASRPSTRLPAV